MKSTGEEVMKMKDDTFDDMYPEGITEQDWEDICEAD